MMLNITFDPFDKHISFFYVVRYIHNDDELQHPSGREDRDCKVLHAVKFMKSDTMTVMLILVLKHPTQFLKLIMEKVIP